MPLTAPFCDLSRPTTFAQTSHYASKMKFFILLVLAAVTTTTNFGQATELSSGHSVELFRGLKLFSNVFTDNPEVKEAIDRLRDQLNSSLESVGQYPSVKSSATESVVNGINVDF